MIYRTRRSFRLWAYCPNGFDRYIVVKSIKVEAGLRVESIDIPEAKRYSFVLLDIPDRGVYYAREWHLRPVSPLELLAECAE